MWPSNLFLAKSSIHVLNGFVFLIAFSFLLAASCTDEYFLCCTQGEDGIVVGSRAHLQDDASAERSFFRTLLMHGFHFLVYILCVRGIRDTQVRVTKVGALCLGRSLIFCHEITITVVDAYFSVI